jgi:hypothetical protein
MILPGNLLIAIKQVLEMEDDVLASIVCEAVADESGMTNCSDDEPSSSTCQHCLTQNRLSERIAHLRSELANYTEPCTVFVVPSKGSGADHRFCARCNKEKCDHKVKE